MTRAPPLRGVREGEESSLPILPIESGQASVIQHLGSLAAADAQQQLAIDAPTVRLVRIERRLELREA